LTFSTFSQEDRYKTYRKEQRQKKKNKGNSKSSANFESLGGGAVDDDMAAMMGFSGFGGSKKN